MRPFAISLLLSLAPMGATSLAADDLTSRAFPEPPKPSERVFLAGRPATGQGASFNASRRDREHAEKQMTNYDADGNRIIEGAEWEKVGRMTRKADRNGDRRLTLDELIVHASGGAQAKQTRTGGSARTARQSQRLTTPVETLPEGLPSWFRQKDKDGDGQVAMHEYARRWTGSTLRKFQGLDQNDDGLITPDESRR